MRLRYSLFLLLFMIISLSHTEVSSYHPDSETNYKPVSPFTPLQVSEPLENDSVPVITTNKTLIEWGNVVTIFHGMIDNNQFIAGYNYSIYLAEGVQDDLRNDTSLLTNYTLLNEGITQNERDEFSFKSYNDPTLADLFLGQYTLFLVINSTHRGLLNATTFFEVISNPGANVALSFKPVIGSFDGEDNVIRLQLHQSKQILVILKNTGQNNAFNISLILGPINEPIGLTNASFPVTAEVLAPAEELRVNFTVQPETFGIGTLDLVLGYVDGQGASKTSSNQLKVITLPEFQISIEGLPNVVEYNEDEGLNIIVLMKHPATFPIAPISVTIKLISLSMTFLPDTLTFDNLTFVYIFKANPFEFGNVRIDLWVSIADPIGDDVEEYIETSRSFELNLLRSEDENTFSNYLSGIAIILYFILIATLAIFYYREDIRTKFFTQVLGLQLLEKIDYKTTSIVIDGSNIAWEQTNLRHKPTINNIIRAYKALKENGFKKIVIIADAALRYQIDDKEELDRLVKSGFIKLVPAKVNADGFILRFSAENGYLILSNDLFKEYRDTYNWIDERRVPYTILDESFYLHPTFE